MRGKRILLGITGGIAAYKIAFLIRLLKKQGAEVKCILTPSAVDFISPLIASTLSGNPVGIEFWNKDDGSWNNHVDFDRSCFYEYFSKGRLYFFFYESFCQIHKSNNKFI